MASMTASQIHRRMKALADPVRAAGVARYFKTAPGEYGAGDRFLGIRVPTLRGLARECQELSLRDASALLKSRWHEERLLALFVLVRQYGRADAARRDAICRLYLKNTARINNWDLVDCSAEHIVGAHLGGGDRRLLRQFARSPLLWRRRIAIMATGYCIKRGEFGETLRIATLLLDDPHDLIHKAVGWMLREVGKRNRAVEERFLRRYARHMPRTMLRYAIERFPEKLRRAYLAQRSLDSGRGLA